MCIGCGIPEKEKQQHIESVQNKALAYAKEIGKLVIVYIDTDGMYKYMESEAAKSAGVQPFSYAPVL